MIEKIQHLISRFDYGALAIFGIALGMGLAAWGVAYSIGMLNARAVEAMARQPEVAGKVGAHAQLMTFLQEGIGLGCVLLLYMLGNSVMGKFTPAKPVNEIVEVVQKAENSNLGASQSTKNDTHQE